MNFRVGIHLRLGKCLCVVSLLVTVFVFKDIFPSEETKRGFVICCKTKKKKEKEDEKKSRLLTLS